MNCPNLEIWKMEEVGLHRDLQCTKRQGTQIGGRAETSANVETVHLEEN